MTCARFGDFYRERKWRLITRFSLKVMIAGGKGDTPLSNISLGYAPSMTKRQRVTKLQAQDEFRENPNDVKGHQKNIHMTIDVKGHQKNIHMTIHMTSPFDAIKQLFRFKFLALRCDVLNRHVTIIHHMMTQSSIHYYHHSNHHRSLIIAILDAENLDVVVL